MGVSESYEAGKKIGIIGLGSIGVRHVKALMQLGIKDVFALRTGKGNKTIDDDVASVINNVSDVECFKEVDAIIISNPTASHAEAIRKVLPYEKKLFIEKPITDDKISLESLLSDMKSYNAKIQVGFCLRYHKVIRLVKEKINSGILGDVYHARLEVGQYLPLWHPYTDYSEEYYSKKIMGGGAIRTLSHEIDLAQFFFGRPQSVNSVVEKVSDLKIDVDDYSLFLLKYPKTLVRIEIDFLQKNPKRKGIVMGTLADLEYDVFNNLIKIYDKEGKLTEEILVPAADMYLDQMKDFISDNRDFKHYASVEDSQILMKIISLAENNSSDNNWCLV